MEIKPYVKIPQFTASQWLTIVLGLAVIISALIGGMSFWAKPPLIVEGDYSPFSSKQEYEQFYRDHPLMLQRAPDDGNFRYKTSITPGKQAFYRIYLRTPVVHGGEETSKSEYASLLRTYQKEATDWFVANGEDLSRSYVQWIPDPVSYEPTPTPEKRPPKKKP